MIIYAVAIKNKVNIFRNLKLFHKIFSLLLLVCEQSENFKFIMKEEKFRCEYTEKKKVTKWRMKSFLSTQQVEFVGGKINFPQFYIVYLHNKEGKKSVRRKKSFPVPAGVDSTTTEVRKSFRSFGCFWLFSLLSHRDVKGNSDVETWCTYGAWKAWWIIWEIFILVSSARNKMCSTRMCMMICDESCW